ncbi:glycoside hydrolase family 18 [Sphingobacterium sp. Mn56C]|uniref:glycoside hydrolase family 18 n=1 Tax=Sphingobacterium sp. Mn56C TaxID=3395261 RepID=UPI003BDB50B4
MKFQALNIKRYMLVLLCGGLLLNGAACKKWTEPKPLDIASPDLEQQNPEIYGKYLEDLRAFKNNPHKINLGWFNNSKKNPTSQGDHFAVVPDSLDYLVLESPLALVDREVEAMQALLEKKQTKVLFEIDFNTIKSSYLMQDTLDIPFASFLKDTVTAILSATAKYPYQGLVVSYNGKDVNHLSEDETKQVQAEEDLFFDLIKPAHSTYAGKTLAFKGTPQYLFRKDMLTDYAFIILPTDAVLDLGGLSYAVLSASVAQVPTHRFVVLASMTSYKADEAKLGYFANGARAALATAQWAAAVQQGIKIHGVGYKNLSYDYYNVLKSYQYSREAIQIINPAMKQK